MWCINSLLLKAYSQDQNVDIGYGVSNKISLNICLNIFFYTVHGNIAHEEIIIRQEIMEVTIATVI